MRVGTKSILWGYHAFWLHPWFVAWGWWKIWGFPWDPRLWVAFFVHDIGYWGCPNMDGKEGERHPEWGAEMVGRLFDWRGWSEPVEGFRYPTEKWLRLVLFHSETYASLYKAPRSRLWAPDKLALVLTPTWLYILLTRLSGEIQEYRSNTGKYPDLDQRGDREWIESVKVRIQEKVEWYLALEPLLITRGN